MFLLYDTPINICFPEQQIYCHEIQTIHNVYCKIILNPLMYMLPVSQTTKSMLKLIEVNFILTKGSVTYLHQPEKRRINQMICLPQNHFS